jgi:hypothetical protein
MGYKLWRINPEFGDSSKKETNPAWKYQTIAAIMLLGCSLYANLICIVYERTWDIGPTTLNRIRNVSLHLCGIILCLVCMAIEVEWIQLLDEMTAFRNWLWRAVLYCVLAALTFEPTKGFYYYEYIGYVSSGLLTNAGLYVLFGMYFFATETRRQAFDDSL